MSDVSIVLVTGPSEQYLPDADRQELKQVAEPEWNVAGNPWHGIG